MPPGPDAGVSAQVNRPLEVALDATPLIGRQTGVGVFCREVLASLAERDDVFASAFAVSWRRRDAIASSVPPGVMHRQRAMPARPLHWLWRRSSVPPIEWFVGRVDVVHGTNFVVPPARRAARVVTVHDLTPLRFPQMCDSSTLVYPILVRNAIRSGAWVHTHSEFVAAEVVEAFGADPAKVRAVHSGVPRLPNVLEEDRSSTRLKLPPGTSRYLLAVGTAEPRKDLPGLVRAFDEVGAERSDLALVLAGPEGWGESDLQAAVNESRHPERIVRTGWIDDLTLARALRDAEVLVYPSIYEGFGFPPLQAMQVGAPVVTTFAGSLPEVTDGAALLVEPGDSEALAGAICRLLDSPELREEMVKRGRDCAEQYSWEKCAEGLVGLYRDAKASGAG